MNGKNSIVEPGSGVNLTPSEHGKDCIGNGIHEGQECKCDECDYYLICFPDWKEEGFYEDKRKRAVM